MVGLRHVIPAEHIQLYTYNHDPAFPGFPKSPFSSILVMAASYSQPPGISHVPEQVDTSVGLNGIDAEREVKVSYSSLPHKDQLAILCLARMADPLAQSSIQVMNHQQSEVS